MSMKDVVEQCAIDDMIITYTNASKDFISNKIKSSRKFYDPVTGKRLRKYYVRVNNFLKTHGLANGMIVIDSKTPVKTKHGNDICDGHESSDESEVDGEDVDNNNAKKGKRKRPATSGKQKQHTKRRRKGQNGHSNAATIVPIPERYAFTVHSVQGKTVETTLYIDMFKMVDIRVLYTALSRVREMDQLRVFTNTELRDLEESGDVLRSYIYRITSSANSFVYIGHTSGLNPEARFMTHVTTYRQFVRNWVGKIIVGHDGQSYSVTIPPQAQLRGYVKQYCTSYQVLHPDEKCAKFEILEEVIFPADTSAEEQRRQIEGLEKEYIMKYAGHGITNSLGLEFA